MRAISIVLTVAVLLVMVGQVWAAEQTCPPTKPEHHGHDNFLMMGPWNFLKQLNLTDDQKAKVKELRKEYVPKFKAAADSVLTPEQKKARDEAIAAAKTSGKKPGVFTAKLNLTDDQRAKIREAVKPLEKEVREKTNAILTPQQQEQLKAMMAEHKAKKE